ncbi:hypothetical protein CAOG_07645 [Capsaspora owczarzaki ATCC 30864]|uniref:Transcription factor IIIC subunit 5 HTH domain-containing protein n=1 Tax=Capsaspora owczarzaki (strain ATCC 30864) TaxID=595528 RepID=A0A0D2WW78_CAPO3|nr:hypothetical protein CAOG_07645 [Capsaspora owczarzaki ATCC 30864]KJE97200.1 hypothetical protein CAOG_007645 [Capsaspora owczarzaki ATCC 30864]|eukprot:XP_004343519.1 hypothetical protein CAOG_07645 [Capsaspora owczarzaki ATCC 30864]
MSDDENHNQDASAVTPELIAATVLEHRRAKASQPTKYRFINVLAGGPGGAGMGGAGTGGGQGGRLRPSNMTGSSDEIAGHHAGQGSGSGFGIGSGTADGAADDDALLDYAEIDQMSSRMAGYWPGAASASTATVPAAGAGTSATTDARSMTLARRPRQSTRNHGGALEPDLQLPIESERSLEPGRVHRTAPSASGLDGGLGGASSARGVADEPVNRSAELGLEPGKPIPTLFAIHYPGNVKNVDRAVTTLGGHAAVNKAAQLNGELQLNFRPEATFSAAVRSDKTRPCASLLVRLQAPTGGMSKDVTISVRGVIATSTQFRALAPVQILPAPPVPAQRSLEGASLDEVGDACIFSRTDMQLPPFSFTHIDQPRTYKFKPPISNSAASNSTAPMAQKSSVRVNFSLSAPQPTGPPRGLPTTRNTAQSARLAKELHRLFQERPIWSRLSLITRLRREGISTSLVMPLLMSTAFRYSTGPWRTLWVRFGYDPRRDPNARSYQMIDLRFAGNVPLAPSLKSERTAASIAASQFADVFIPNTSPSQRQCCMQVCDILLRDVQQLLKTPVPALDVRFGYFRRKDVEAIVTSVKAQTPMTVVLATPELFKAALRNAGVDPERYSPSAITLSEPLGDSSPFAPIPMDTSESATSDVPSLSVAPHLSSSYGGAFLAEQLDDVAEFDVFDQESTDDEADNTTARHPHNEFDNDADDGDDDEYDDKEDDDAYADPFDHDDE